MGRALVRGMAVLLGFCLVAPSLAAETLRVPSDYLTIKEALDSAVSGDTVLVAPGTYVVTLTADADTRIVMPAGVVLMSEEGPEATIIEICQYTICIEFFDSELARVGGFTLRQSPDAGCSNPMGFTYGVHCYECTNVIVEDCIIEHLSYGIGVDGESQGWWYPIFRNNLIRNCAIGVGCYDVFGYDRPLVSGTTITNCSYGAEVRNSRPYFDSDSITYCHDGLYYYGECGGDCSRCLIAYNEACGAYIDTDPPIASPGFNLHWNKAEANDIYENGSWDIWYAHSGDDALVMAILNYWGSDCPDFDSRIHGRVNHTSWVDSTHTRIITEADCPNAAQPTTWSSIKAMYR